MHSTIGRELKIRVGQVVSATRRVTPRASKSAPNAIILVHDWYCRGPSERLCERGGVGRPHDPVADGAIGLGHFEVELGQVVNGDRPGRQAKDESTMYQSVGVAIQDIATGRLLVDQARESGVGIELPLS